MTTVKLDKKLAAKPAVHAFVIGVGDYLALDGGSAQEPDAETWGLGQLAAAPESALAVAQWLANELTLTAGVDGPDRPLGSIELLISKAGKPATFKDPKSKKAVKVERASMENVKAAFDAWFERAKTHEQNIALFYFSGHGFNKERDCLLLDGFNGKKKNPFEDVIDFENFVRGMDMCLPRQQCFFSDACRNQSEELRKKVGDFRGEPLIIRTDPLPSDEPRDVAIVRATAINQAAYGSTNGLTRFTAALLKVLRGAGCTDLNARWEVRTEDLVPSLNALLDHETVTRKLPRQRAMLGGESSGFAVHVPPKPIVPAVVACDPDTDTPNALFQYASKAKPIEKQERSKKLPDVWEVELAIDREYEFVARFDNGQERKHVAVAQPPLHRVKL